MEKSVILKSDKILKIGILRCVETIELQRILDVIKDGYFGQHTLRELKSKYNKDKISLNKLSSMGVKVRKKIPTKEIWWLNVK